MPLLNAQTRWLAAPLILTGLLSCTRLPQSVDRSTPIQVVQYTDKVITVAAAKQPANVNSIVVLKGKIGNRAPLLGGVAYELYDASGSIWVLTKDPAPSQGDEILVKGKMQYQSIPLNGKEQGSAYVEQQQLLQHTPAIKS